MLILILIRRLVVGLTRNWMSGIKALSMLSMSLLVYIDDGDIQADISRSRLVVRAMLLVSRCKSITRNKYRIISKLKLEDTDLLLNNPLHRNYA